jgi:hypothetical protein
MMRLARWTVPLIAVGWLGGCYTYRPLAHDAVADAGSVRLTSPAGMVLFEQGVAPLPGVSRCRAHHLSGRVVRVSGDSIVLTRITEIQPVVGDRARCDGITSASVINEGPERLLIETEQLRPVATMATTVVAVLASTMALLVLLLVAD